MGRATVGVLGAGGAGQGEGVVVVPTTTLAPDVPVVPLDAAPDGTGRLPEVGPQERPDEGGPGVAPRPSVVQAVATGLVQEVASVAVRLPSGLAPIASSRRVPARNVPIPVGNASTRLSGVPAFLPIHYSLLLLVFADGHPFLHRWAAAHRARVSVLAQAFLEAPWRLQGAEQQVARRAVYVQVQ